MSYRCPVSNTCSSIDNAIKYLHDALVDLNDALKCEDIDDMKWEIETAHSRISDIDLEELRDQNAKLRQWGEDLALDADGA